MSKLRWHNLKSHFDAAQNAKQKYWKKANRWPYLQVAVMTAKALDPASVLEIGTMGLPLCLDSNTMSLDGIDKVTHDAGKAPWPFEDKAFDLGIALQVWEHIPEKEVFFSEMGRVCSKRIISIPYKWRKMSNPDNCHLNIEMDDVVRWAGGRFPDAYCILGSGDRKRLMTLWT